MYKDNIAIDDGTSTGDQTKRNPKVDVGGYKFRIFAAWSKGIDAAMQSNAHKMMFYSMGEGLTNDELTALFNAVTNFNEVTGRNFDPNSGGGGGPSLGGGGTTGGGTTGGGTGGSDPGGDPGGGMTG